MKRKLTIKNLNIRSFVTDTKLVNSATLKGGYDHDYWTESGPWRYCPTDACTGVNCGSANPC